MNLQQAVTAVLGKYGDFSGRARRSEYWYWGLAVFLVGVVFQILAAIAHPLIFIYYIFLLAVLIPGLAVLWRRLHDTGRSGAWFAIILVPLAGAIVLLVFACLDSTPGDNQYGPNPKGAGGYGQPGW